MMQASPITAALLGASSTIAEAKDAARRNVTDDNSYGSSAGQQPVEESGEAARLTAAIHRLISERDRHRNEAAAQTAELADLRSANEELRSRNEAIALLRDHYLRLVTEMLAQLKQIDAAITASVQKTLDAAGQLEERDATLISLARRLSPNRDGS